MIDLGIANGIIKLIVRYQAGENLQRRIQPNLFSKYPGQIAN